MTSELTRDEINARALRAIDALGLTVGLTLGADRKTAVLIALRGRGFMLSELEAACRELMTDKEFGDKITRYAGTLAPSDISDKIYEMRKRKRVARPYDVPQIRGAQHIGQLIQGRRELPPGDRD